MRQKNELRKKYLNKCGINSNVENIIIDSLGKSWVGFEPRPFGTEG
jgi:hypothetical protein